MKKIIKIALIITIITILFCVIGETITAKEIDAKDIKWNVSEGLTQKPDANVLIYYDGDYSLRIMDANDNNLSNMKNGFKKGEDGFYRNNWANAIGSESSDYIGAISSITYGEYVKINDNIYWVEANWMGSSTGSSNQVKNDLSHPNLEKLMGYLNYLNENNDVEIVDL